AAHHGAWASCRSWCVAAARRWKRPATAVTQGTGTCGQTECGARDRDATLSEAFYGKTRTLNF
ncbi:MAG TPA: hypothetical protein VLQ80_12995, partial [Candidatus Saccharimonadia bacterium]|nr:hypothetical protein [Candidatus Saccharimonadia bacterium]